MRITEALSKLAEKARLRSLPLPVISLPRYALISVATSIEDDLGGPIFNSPTGNGFQYVGISFIPIQGKPRVRVKAGRREIYDDWTVDLGRFAVWSSSEERDKFLRAWYNTLPQPLQPGELLS